jgi:hypothetical protein
LKRLIGVLMPCSDKITGWLVMVWRVMPTSVRFDGAFMVCCCGTTLRAQSYPEYFEKKKPGIFGLPVILRNKSCLFLY